jgi:hypothetical protein
MTGQKYTPRHGTRVRLAATAEHEMCQQCTVMAPLPNPSQQSVVRQFRDGVRMKCSILRFGKSSAFQEPTVSRIQTSKCVSLGHT